MSSLLAVLMVIDSGMLVIHEWCHSFFQYIQRWKASFQARDKGYADSAAAHPAHGIAPLLEVLLETLRVGFDEDLHDRHAGITIVFDHFSIS